MERPLKKSEIDYVLFHLNHHCTLSDEIKEHFVFAHDIDEIPTNRRSIVFLQSRQTMNPIKLNWHDTLIPVLFPHPLLNATITSDSKNNIIVHHDFIKSAFFLLSSYQEHFISDRDIHGRFPYEASIQKQLNIAYLPVVNYYFDILITAIDQFCKQENLPFSRKRMFNEFGFFLSHDVDRIALYSWRQMTHKTLQLFGLRPSTNTIASILKTIASGILHNIAPCAIEDPWWNFKHIIKQETSLGIRSTFYFLSRQGKMDSRFTFKNQRIRKLISQLNDNGFETGLHGSYYSIDNRSVMVKQTAEMKNATGINPKGIRQHYLRAEMPTTLRLQQQVGFEYDTSLGFASHAGYRNSYCYPFKPFDFEKGEMLDIWELPLMLMEVSVLDYQKEGFTGLETSSMKMVEEAWKFGGFFSLLWHNCRMSDHDYAGVGSFYESLLAKIMQHGAESVTGSGIVAKIK
jgi:hypothetical protein